MRKTITLALAIGCLSFPALASAAGGTYSTTFNLNDTSPTFNPRADLSRRSGDDQLRTQRDPDDR